MAVMYFATIEQSGSKCMSIWAGDSRCFSLDADEGLRQLTWDDLKSRGDAFDNLNEDSPLSNYLNADSNFELHYQIVPFERPGIFIAATDGCFGYVRTPMHFEYLLLETMNRATDFDGWKQHLAGELSRIAGDDVSMVVAVVGWPNYQMVKADFATRRSHLLSEYIMKLDKFDSQIDQMTIDLANARRNREELRTRLWSQYKAAYEALMTQSKPPQ